MSLEVYTSFERHLDRKSTRLNSSHANISYAVFCLKKKKKRLAQTRTCLGCLCVVWSVLLRGVAASAHASIVHTASYRLDHHFLRFIFFFKDGASTEFLPLPLPVLLPI